MKEIIYNAKTKQQEIIESELTEQETTRIEQEQQERVKQFRINEIKELLTELTKDFAQGQAGLVIENIDEKKQQFRELHSELRILLGKEPRILRSESDAVEKGESV